LLGPIVGPGLRVLFVGVNPSLRSAEVGHHFARPGNRFWPTLQAAGFTSRRLRPDEDHALPAYGVGVTNIASRPTRAAAELTASELRDGAVELERTVRLHAPRLVAVVGLTAYRTAFERPRAVMGLAPDEMAVARCGSCRIRAGSMRTTSLRTSPACTRRRAPTPTR
jgi:TDG/mug DNA glycosylase family protein